MNVFEHRSKFEKDVDYELATKKKQISTLRKSYKIREEKYQKIPALKVMSKIEYEMHEEQKGYGPTDEAVRTVDDYEDICGIYVRKNWKGENPNVEKEVPEQFINEDEDEGCTLI